MNKTVFFILSTIFSFQASSGSMAYLPIQEALSHSIFNDVDEKKMVVIDIDSKSLIKTIEFETPVNQVFVSNYGGDVFAAHYDFNTIYRIDAKSLNVIKKWDNLPVKPKRIVLNKDNLKILFYEHLGNKVYSLDLITGNVSEAYTHDNPIVNMHISKNLDSLTLISDFNLSEILVTELSTMTFNKKSEIQINKPGGSTQNAHTKINGTGTSLFVWYGIEPRSIQSHDLTTGVERWEFTQNNQKLMFSHDEDDQVVIFTNQQAFIVDEMSGSIMSTLDMPLSFRFRKEYIVNSLGNQKALIANATHRFCSQTGCQVTSNPQLKVYDFSTGTIQEIFTSNDILGGSGVTGRFIGPNALSSVQVPVLSKEGLILLILTLGFIGTFGLKKLKI